VFGDGRQRRCFGSVFDVVEALVRIAKSDRVIGEIINIGNDEEISIAALAAQIRSQLASHSEIVSISYEQAYGRGFEDMLRRIPSLTKLEHLVGFRPRIPLHAIINAVADDMIRRGVVPASRTRERALPQPVLQQA